MGGAFGADQAAYNLAAYHGLTSGVQHPNFRRVATLQRTPGEALGWNGRQMVNPDGTVSPIVHKYDRHPRLEAEFRRLWAADLPAPASTAALTAWCRSLGETARTVEHPFNAGLMLEDLVAQARAALHSKP